MLTITPQPPQQKVAPIEVDATFTRPWYMYFFAVTSALADFIAGAVYGRPALLNIGRITKVTAAGTIGEAAFKDTDVVLGASALTHDGRLTMVSATDGTISESAVTDNGTSVAAAARNMVVSQTISGAVQPVYVLTATGVTALGRLTRISAAVPRLDLLANISFDGTDWNLDDTGAAGARLAMTSAGMVYATFTAGANPRTSTNQFAVDPASGSADIPTEYRVAGTKVVGARGAALTAAGAAVVGSASAAYDPTTRACINDLVTLANNLRTRANEMEARLSSAAGHGLFT